MATITNKMKNLTKIKITIENSETIKPVSREILLERLNRFYACRDFELSRLWQRSLFLAAFLMLTFSGYGHLVVSDKNEDIYFHIIGGGLALIGIIISILWIMMGKSSKAWYEVYESRICDIEARKEMGIEENYQMGVYGSEAKTINNSLFSTASGKYSPSRINIIIGQLSLILWFFIETFHTRSLIAEMSVNDSFVKNILLSGLLAFLFTFVIAKYLKEVLKSNNL